MDCIYVNNFRNFEDTFISLKKVNFLIGENSSGKTSILSLMNLLQSNSFWINFELNNDDIQLGGFENIVNNNNNFFEIAVEKTGKSRKSKNTKRILYKMKFINIDGMPLLSEFFFENKEIKLFILKEKKEIKYTVEKKYGKTQSIFNTDFKSWVKKIDNEKKFKNRLPEAFEKNTIPFHILFDIILNLENKLINPKQSSFNIVSDIDLFTHSEQKAWIAPIRAKPKEFYPNYRPRFTSEGDHTPFIMRNLDGNGDRTKQTQLKKSIISFGKESGLFDDIITETLNSKKTSPFEVSIIKNGNPYNIASVGYGVSQVFPVIIEMIFRIKGTTFFIQQPEVHLHPRAQAAWGELLFHVAQDDEKTFFIETHSDFTVDRFRQIQNSNEKKLDSQVLYFENSNKLNKVYEVPIDKNGAFINQPDGFKDFFMTETLRMLVLE